jgi:hypothetical protein
MPEARGRLRCSAGLAGRTVSIVGWRGGSPAVLLRLHRANGREEDHLLRPGSGSARLGGVATTVVRARAVERSLLGRTWDGETLRAAQAAVGSDATPISDHRASASYRDRAVRGLLQRWWYETGHDAPSVDLDVWGGR